MTARTPADHHASTVTAAGAQVESYLASLAPDARRELEAIRETIRAAAPDAMESFSYNMPAFTMDGQPLVWYAAWRQHISLYPISEGIARANSADLTNYATTKGTIRFSRKEPVPLPLISRLVQARLEELRSADG